MVQSLSPSTRARSLVREPSRLALASLVQGALLLAGLGWAGIARGQDSEVRPEDVKAVLIHHCLRYFEWPDVPADDRVVIGVLGDSLLTEPLRAIAKGATGPLRVVVRAEQHLDALDGARVVFIDASAEALLPEALERFGSRGVLTVADSAGWARRGVIVNFAGRGRRVTLELNPVAAERAGLVPRPELLRLAKTVEDDRSPGPDVSEAEHAGFLVIVNANNRYSGAEDEMKEVARTIFLRQQRTWPGTAEAESAGEPLCRPAGHPAQVAFARQVLDMSSNELRTHWTKLHESQGLAAPTEVGSVKALLRRVAQSEGALGVLAEGEALPAKVRVLFRFETE